MDFIITVVKKLYDYTIGAYFSAIGDAFVEGEWGLLLLLLSPFIMFLIRFVTAQSPEEEQKSKGDAFVRKVSRWIFLNEPKFHNVIIPLENVGAAGADIVTVGKKGVFCMKCQNLGNGSLTLYGAATDMEWRIKDQHAITLDSVSNPLQLNQFCVDALNELLSTNRIYNVVITNTKYDIMWAGMRYKKDFNDMLNDGMALLNYSGIYEFEKAAEKLPDVFNDEEVEEIREILKGYECIEK